MTHGWDKHFIWIKLVSFIFCLFVDVLRGVEMAWEVWESKRSGVGSKGSNYEVMISKDKEGRICIYLDDKALKKLRWKKGDRAQIKFDHQEKLIGLERSNDCGNTLSKQAPKRLRVVFTLPSNLADVCCNGSARRFTSEEWMATDDGMLVVDMVQKADH